MDGVDEADLSIVQSEDHGGGANPFAEEANSFEEIPVSNPGAGENHLLAGSQIGGVIDALGIFHAHLG